MEFGKKLRDERLKLGLSLEDIEEETKIRKFYLNALEEEDFGSLPPQVYASGFVKRYAMVLGLDEQEMVREFKEQAYGPEEDAESEEIIEPAPIKEIKERKPFPIKNIVAGLVFLALVVWLGSYPASCIVQWSQNKAAPPTQPRIGQNQTGKSPNETSPSTTQNKTPASTGVKVKIEAVQRTWLSVGVDGKIVYTGTMVAGETKNFEGTSVVHIHTGNAGGMSISVNGKAVPAMGKTGEIKDQDFTANQ